MISRVGHKGPSPTEMKQQQDLLSLHSLSPPGDQLSSSSSSSSSSSTCTTNTDSDSLHLSPRRAKEQQQQQQQQQQLEQQPRKPIMIKYNYYDYNGSRQEQENHDMNYGLANLKEKRVHRQLSPTFKQSLDQIVRNSAASQQQQQSASSSPQPPTSPQLVHHRLGATTARRYKLNAYEQRCLRCNKTVYQMDKVGPLKDFTFYHQSCFKCRECGTKLTLRTYFNNQQRSGDQEVYCHRHCPQPGPGKLDNQSVGIRCALNAPKVFDPATAHLATATTTSDSPTFNELDGNHIDARALHIQHAVQQTRQLHHMNKRQPSSQHLNLTATVSEDAATKQRMVAQLISRRLEFLEPKQKLLEMRHREEEDALFQAFELKWRQEEAGISEQIREEWQVELGKLLEKYKRQLSNISASNHHHHHQRQVAAEAAALKAAAANTELATSRGGQQPEMIEVERLNLEKSMTIKLDRKKETLKRKLKEFERQATAELVEKQSREMLALISMKLAEYKEQQQQKQQQQRQRKSADLEQLEAATMEGLAGLHLNPTRPASGATRTAETLALPPPPPPCAPPPTSKWELYNNEEPDEVFRDVDELAINVAREDQNSFTDLVHHLTRRCVTDVEKCRAIFRWITVKNLNTMQFGAEVKPDTPLGLLRGIKNGSESYHVLFKRLCSYAGLHCVVIKGYSKSAGYQPGVKFEGNRFRNSWNAVFVAGAWRFVQCNWGARHLVSVAVMQDKGQDKGGQQPQPHQAVPGRSHQHHHHRHSHSSHQSPNHGRRGLAAPVAASAAAPTAGAQQDPRHHLSAPQSPKSQKRPKEETRQADSLRYEYDDHYFLTDPDEFIYEFHPLAPEWQLINSRPISLQEFEQLPFVRSLFFKYGLYFPQHDIRSVLLADSSGATTIKIGMPTHMIPSLIFHYNLKYYDSDQEHYEGVSLKRFVMQSIESGGGSDTGGGGSGGGSALLSNIVSFRVHLPADGAYILDIFANSTTPSQYITGEPMKFKSVCKFKIVAKNLKTVMVPLPDCASGEYGPMKATRLFGIIPITHENGLIVVQNDKRFLEIQFRMTRPLLDFMASLHKNGYDERQLSKSIKIFIDGDIVFVTVKFFEDGQYGLDLYTRDQSAPSPPLPSLGNAPHNNNNNNNQQVAPYHHHHQDAPPEPRKQLLTHCCKYLINVRTPQNRQ